MKAVHVLRKPCAEPTVAANVLRHGCGAINVDACRVGTDGGTKAVNFVAKDDRRLVRWDEGHRGKRNDIDDIGKGRWPANVVFQHLEGCVQAGVRKVKGDGRAGDMAKSEGGSGGIWAKSTGTPAGALYGNETVAAWSCAEGCPVAVLDAQGGNSTSPSMVTRGGLRGMSFGMGRQEDVPCYGDTGGASRFFKQFGGKSE